MKSRFFLVLAIGLCMGFGAGAQELSTKQEVAVFKLNYFGAPVYAPENITVSATIGNVTVSASVQGSGNANADNIFKQTIAQVDATILQSMQELGRFIIMGMPQRLSSDDVGNFIQAVKDYKTENLVIPEAVSLGRQTFTVADFNKLVGSFVVIIPSVTYYNLYLDKSTYKAEITTDVTVIDIASNQQIGKFKIETSASDSNEAKAMKSAVDSLPSQLTYELRKVPAFQISTGVADIKGADVIVEFGENMGIKIGDEYHLTRTRQVGKFTNEEKEGLLVIKDVKKEFSVAQVIRGTPAVGDQLRELPRLGVDAEPYLNLLYMLNATGGEIGGVALGLKASSTRGFYAVRPFGGIELILSDALPTYSGWGVTLLPVSAYFGAEAVMYMGKIKFVPQAAIGAIYYVNLNSDTASDDPFEYLTHLRAHIKAQGSYLLNDNMYLYVEGGLMGNLSINTNLDSFAAIIGGAGVSFKL